MGAMWRSAWCYPYAFLDEQPDTVFSRLAEAGLNSVSVAAAYHSGRMLFPHDPRRKVVMLEGGVVYFRPELHRYQGPLQPVVSSLCRELDPLARVVGAAEQHQFGVSAWVVCMHNSRLGSAHPQLTLRNAFGDHYVHALCPAQPAVRSYIIALACDMARYPIAALDLEALGFMGFEHQHHHHKAGLALSKLDTYLLSLCFCPACTAGMQQAGVETCRLKRGVRQYLEQRFAGHASAFPADGDSDLLAELEALLGTDVHAMLAYRERVVVSLVHELKQALSTALPIMLRTALSPFFTGGKSALRPAAAKQAGTPLTLTFFGSSPQAIEQGARTARMSLGSSPIHAGVMACAPDTRSEEDLLARCSALGGGWAGIHFYQYDLMPEVSLAWIRRACNETKDLSDH